MPASPVRKIKLHNNWCQCRGQVECYQIHTNC
jgi:hypothetical protein